MASGSTVWLQAALIGVMAAGSAHAQIYPEKPIKLILPAAAGGPTDVPARMLAQMLPFEGITIARPLVREGKLRALAVLSERRTPLAPDLPTMAESGVPDFVVTTFNGVRAPAGTPAAIVNTLNHAINEDLKAPEMQKRLTQLGAISIAATPAEVGAFIVKKRNRRTAVAKAAHVKID